MPSDNAPTRYVAERCGLSQAMFEATHTGFSCTGYVFYGNGVHRDLHSFPTRRSSDLLENAPDWNISRQIWWGHQLPLWECPDGHVTVEETEPDACTECGSSELTRSTDVLDTWFSSALWPFATLGWPEDTEDLR